MVGSAEGATYPKELYHMKTTNVIIVHLRKPKKSNLKEMRSDPFYELGSFGCTKCHSRNLMHPHRAHELDGVRFAFAQGGPLGFRLVHLTPPVQVVVHIDRCELVWTPADAPFRYDAAPVLVNADEKELDFPLLVADLKPILRKTWPARFSSAFRSRRAPLDESVAAEVARVFDRKRAKAKPEMLAGSYVDTLPYPPNKRDETRKATLAALRAKAKALRSRKHKSSCSPTSAPPNRKPARLSPN